MFSALWNQTAGGWSVQKLLSTSWSQKDQHHRHQQVPPANAQHHGVFLILPLISCVCCRSGGCFVWRRWISWVTSSPTGSVCTRTSIVFLLWWARSWRFTARYWILSERNQCRLGVSWVLMMWFCILSGWLWFVVFQEQQKLKLMKPQDSVRTVQLKDPEIAQVLWLCTCICYLLGRMS